jgi:hypothetical protein
LTDVDGTKDYYTHSKDGENRKFLWGISWQMPGRQTKNKKDNIQMEREIGCGGLIQ